ncbi:MAG: heavy metal translocating P-type ATPase metal-binding domain-containing protein [Methylococcaceae bacterium]
MSIIKYRQICELCSQPVELEDFTLNTTEGLKKFCCLGCLSIYQLLNEEKLIANKQ